MASNGSDKGVPAAEKPPVGLSKTVVGWLDRVNKKLTPARFWRVLSEWPDSDGMLLYLYRRYPEIDRKLYNPKANLYIGLLKNEDAKLSEEGLLRAWGSGEYRLKFLDDGRPSGRKEVCTTVVSVNDPDRPPVIENMEELVLESPRNRSYINGLRARGILPAASADNVTVAPADAATSELAGVASEVIRQGLNTSQSPAGAMAAVADIYRTAAGEAVKLTAAQSRPVDPVEQAVRLKKLLGANENSGLINMLIEQAQREHELLVGLLTKQSAPDAGLSGELETLEHLLTVVDRLGTRGSGGGGSWLETIPSIADAAARMFQSVAQIRTAPVPGSGSPAAPAAGAPAAPAAGAPAAPGVGGPVAPSGGAPVAPGGGSPAAPVSLASPGAVAEMAGRVCAAIEDGVSGDVFAQSLDVVYGPAVYNQICSLGRGPVLDLLRSSVPEEQRLQVVEFVNRFFDYQGAAAGAAAPESEVTQ